MSSGKLNCFLFFPKFFDVAFAAVVVDGVATLLDNADVPNLADGP